MKEYHPLPFDNAAAVKLEQEVGTTLAEVVARYVEQGFTQTVVHRELSTVLYRAAVNLSPQPLPEAPKPAVL